ncbi:diguanylate cyclase (GGDEF)-like protein [Bradyrhizobium niftali]
MVDVTVRRAPEIRIAYMAHHVNPFADRALYQKRLGQALECGNAAGQRTAVSRHQFKKVNDYPGHPTRDRMLERAADRLRLQLNGNSLAARLGDDELAIILVAAASPKRLPTLPLG